MKIKKVRKRHARTSAVRNGQDDEEGIFLSDLAETTKNAQELELGCDILGRFTPEERLGSGRVATVYKAYDTRLERDIAIKIVSHEATVQNLGPELLRREVAIQRCLPQTNRVIHLYDLYPFEHGGKAMLLATMEYADGGNLRNWMATFRPRWKHRRMQGWPLYLGIVEACADLQDQGLLLLDIKPENVLIVMEQPKVSDIGLALCRNDSWNSVSELDLPPRSRGTREYMSPEQSLAKDERAVGPESDVYSLAMMGYELMHPRCERAFDPTPEGQLEGPPPYIAISGISEELNHVLACGLEADPKRRYRNVRAFLLDLRKCTESRTESPSPHDSPAQKGAPRSMILSRRNGGSRNKETQAGSRNSMTGNSSIPQPEPHQMVVRREEADRICQILLSDNPSWDIATLRDFARQVERLYPGHPELELARLNLDFREERYRRELSRGWQALQEMDVELSRRHFSRALELNPSDDRIQRVLQAVNLLLDKLVSTFQAMEDCRHPAKSPQMDSLRGGDEEDDLDTLAEDVVAFAGELLGMERNKYG